MQLVSCNHENRIGRGVAHVYNFQKTPTRRLANRHTGPASPRAVLPRLRQNLFDLLLFHIMLVNVRLTCGRVRIEAEIHG